MRVAVYALPICILITVLIVIAGNQMERQERQETMIKYLAHEYSMLNHTCITNCHK